MRAYGPLEHLSRHHHLTWRVSWLSLAIVDLLMLSVSRRLFQRSLCRPNARVVRHPCLHVENKESSSFSMTLVFSPTGSSTSNESLTVTGKVRIRWQLRASAHEKGPVPPLRRQPARSRERYCERDDCIATITSFKKRQLGLSFWRACWHPVCFGFGQGGWGAAD